MSIRFKVVVKYRDDKEDVLDLVNHPQNLNNGYWMFDFSETKRVYIPTEKIDTVAVEDYWSNKKTL